VAAVESDYYGVLHGVQQRHWWYVARRRILGAVIQQVFESGVPEGVLYDLGCGVGANLPLLERFGRVHGVDSAPEAIQFCAERGHHNVTRHDLDSLEGLPEQSASLVLLADVIEHLDDEAPCLQAAERLLKPGGVIVITVPAFMFLWSPADELSHHRRRYTEPELRKLVSRWFDVERSSYFNTFLFGTVLAGRLAQRVLSRSGHDEAALPPAPVNALLTRVFAAEVPLVTRMRLPFGVSVLCVGRKRAAP
jgi:SAM-dependent methyltransferase